MKNFYFLFLLISGMFFATCQDQPADTAKEQDPSEDIIISLNAYSFNDVLSARSMRDSHQVYTLFNLLDWCSMKGIKALDPTAYFFPTYPAVPSDEYLARFKKVAGELGVAISGTGIRNDFASPDPAVRAAGVELAKKWIVAAAKIGAPVIRLFAGKIHPDYENDWEKQATWMVACYQECAQFAEQYGVKIGIQNHGDMLKTADECLWILEKVDADNVGIIVDIGNFKTTDPYADIAKIAPHAVNWQVKESVFGIGHEIKTDFDKLARIIKDSGYKGYLPLETILVRNQPYDAFATIPEMVKQMEAALIQAYN